MSRNEMLLMQYRCRSAARGAKIVGWAEDLDVSASAKAPWDALMSWRLDR